ncbi:MAG: flagellar biosynthesis anti-sigma factor FlgM [Acidobacteria bacterium]|nr:flagellar biosynthesis anti-sigma factor FlgM [Acidobacteriota bacterium]
MCAYEPTDPKISQAEPSPADEVVEASMKIDNPLLAQVSTGGIQPAQAPSGLGQTTGQGKLDSLLDEVQLSNLGAALRELSAREAAKEIEPPVRISAISEQVADGTYAIDPQVLSQKIVQETMSLS